MYRKPSESLVSLMSTENSVLLVLQISSKPHGDVLGMCYPGLILFILVLGDTDTANQECMKPSGTNNNEVLDVGASER